MSSSAEFSVNSVGWFILEGFPWWPVYFCDSKSLRTKLYYLGDGHAKILKKARDYSNDYVLVYFFGSHQFSLARTRRGVLKTWGCSDQSMLLKGHPRHLAKRGNQIEELQMAVHEDFLSQPEDSRLPPHFVPSDMNLALTPPLKVMSEDEMDVEDDEVMHDDDNEERNDETEKEDEEEDEPEGREKTPTKSRVHQEIVEKKSLSSGKRKRKSNEKVSSVTEKTDSKKIKETAESNRPKEQKAAEPRKQTTSGVIPSEDLEKLKLSTEKISTQSAHSTNDTTMLSDDKLSQKLETEIRWILNNCEFEEMTTKTVRRLLQQRLNMNLRSHKGIIKEVVTKVIATMEEGDDEPENSESQTIDTDTEHQPQAPTEPKLENPLIDSDPKESAQADTNPPKVENVPMKAILISEEDLVAAKGKLSDPKVSHEQILECLEALTSMPLTIQLLKRTGISRSVSSLRQHANDKVSASASALRAQWMKLLKADDDQQNDVKGKMIQPHQLPQEGSHTPQLSRLLEMVETLQDHVEYKDQVATKQTRTVHEKQLRVLNDLYQMRLSTKEIIESKVGMAVSRLRKSGNEALVKAASKLRRKWKTEAEAA
uniref:Uncharacterized protein AlNc14C56G4257 n=1 Tax=Albugo laibachii Nc14 TaxID=890382 RepID=F0WC74_9STRA|nr:conserved hypothetical protein [Albugo laibachii Nc14]|eukprot:CCA18787.1 conserved hypothetical protein [Albugo laibachii Nc14]